MSENNAVNRRDVLKATGGALAAAGTMSLAASPVQADYHCSECSSEADLVTNYDGYHYDSCDGEKTDWVYPMGTCLIYHYSCEVDCGWLCTEYYHLVEHEDGGDREWIHEDAVEEWCD